MKLVTMNVNGLHSAWERGLKQYVRDLDADVFCMQEIRTSENLELRFIPGYGEYFLPSSKKGRAGVGAFIKEEPLSVSGGFDMEGSFEEGRAMTIEMEKFYIVNVYAYAAGERLEMLGVKLGWMAALREHVAALMKAKPVIVCGDLNVAITDFDLPGSLNREERESAAGATTSERLWIARLLEKGLVDAWQIAHPKKRGVSWTPYWVRRNNEIYGWRLDYFLVSEELLEKVRSCEILDRTDLSDHRAVMLDIG